MSASEPPKKKRRSTQLAMLSQVLPMEADMHRVAARKRKFGLVVATSNSPEAAANAATQMTLGNGVTPGTDQTNGGGDETPYNLRRRNVDDIRVGGGSWRSPPRQRNVDSEASSSPDASLDASPEKENIRQPFTAMQPVNILVSLEMMTMLFEQTFRCPCCGKHKANPRPSLQVDSVQFGLASEIYVSCKRCSFVAALTPLKQEKTRPGAKESSPQKRESNRFHDYSINYLGALLQQKLGMGLRGLEMIMAFLGIAPSYGSGDKWNRIFNVLGAAEQATCDEVILCNVQEEMRLTREHADKDLATWIESHPNATVAEKTAQHNSLLMMNGDKIGITIGADGAWQKRAIGRSSYNSTTGHNFGVGGYSKKIVSLQCYSKHCRICEEASKKQLEEPRQHRCPKNFDPARSAKSMEAQGALQHCVEIANGPSGAHVAGVVTDDDSTTRSNLKHSLKDEFNQRFGDTWNSRNKRRLGWPVGPDNKLLKDTGKLPLNVPVPLNLLSDPAHRIRGVGYAAFDCKSEAKIKNDKGLMKVECLNIKRNMGYYVKTNQELSDEEFNRRGMCVLQHLFNDHSLCDKRWCTHLKAQDEDDPEKKATLDNPHKYRKIETTEEKKLYKKLKEKIGSLLVPSKMQQVHHRFCTQKNESLNRNATAVAPKDRFYGGTMQLYDRLRVIALTDSIGEYETLVRLFGRLEFNMHPVLCRWAVNKDRDDSSRQVLRRKPEVKMKRAVDIINKIKDGMKQERKATAESMTYATGIANTEGDPVDADVVDIEDGFDTFEWQCTF